MLARVGQGMQQGLRAGGARVAGGPAAGINGMQKGRRKEESMEREGFGLHGNTVL